MNQTVWMESDQGGTDAGALGESEVPMAPNQGAAWPATPSARSPVLLGYLPHQPTACADLGSIALMRLARAWTIVQGHRRKQKLPVMQKPTNQERTRRAVAVLAFSFLLLAPSLFVPAFWQRCLRL